MEVDFGVESIWKDDLCIASIGFSRAYGGGGLGLCRMKSLVDSEMFLCVDKIKLEKFGVDYSDATSNRVYRPPLGCIWPSNVKQGTKTLPESQPHDLLILTTPGTCISGQF